MTYVIRLDVPDVDPPLYMTPPEHGIPGFTPVAPAAWRFDRKDDARRWVNRLVNSREYATILEVPDAA